MTPPRICSFFPTATEILYAIGAGRYVVGRSEHCHYPPQVTRKPIVVGSRVKKIARQDSLAIHRAVSKLKRQGAHQFEVHVQALQRLKPDLIVTQELCSVCAASHSEVDEAVRELSPKPRVIYFRAQRISELFRETKLLGRMVGREGTANQLVNRLQKRIDRVRHLVKSVPSTPRVFCCEWLSPLMAAGHWIPEMVTLAGGKDDLGIKGSSSRWLTWKEVRSYNPEVILTMPCSFTIPQTLREKKRLTGLAGWERLSAVRSGKVFAVEGSFFHHAGPRLVDGLELMARLFHPRIVPADSYRRYFRRIL